MADDKTASGIEDLTQIDVSEDGDLRDWAKKLDATPEQIREAVKAVGNRAADVEMHLKSTHASTNADQQARSDAVDKAR
jgi:hypothetical protein